SGGAGIFVFAPPTTTARATVRNSIIAGNTGFAGPADVSGTLTSQGHNLIGAGGMGYTSTDPVGTAAFPLHPPLEPLGDYAALPPPARRRRPRTRPDHLAHPAAPPPPAHLRLPRVALAFIDIAAVEPQPAEMMNRPPPDVAISGPGRAVRGQPLEFAGRFTDP